jgi:Holliday junction resolvase RusA-like endonuclease
MSHHDTDMPEELQSLSIIIFGEPASKANSRKMVRFGNMPRLIKSDKARAYAVAFQQQCKSITPLMSGDLRVTMWIYYASRRPDLDDSLILDLMQGLIYENDRQVKERHLYWGLDPERPRAEIIIERMEDVAPKKKPRTGRGKERSNCYEAGIPEKHAGTV